MTPQETKHMQCTVIRAQAYGRLFGGKPVAAFPFHKLQGKSDGPYLIDVFVYAMEMQGDDRAIYAAVTNGMSDQRMAEGDTPDQPRRRELIQYFRECSEGHAKRLRDMAWLPLHDGFLLDTITLWRGSGQLSRAHPGRMRSSCCRCSARIVSLPSRSTATKSRSCGIFRFLIRSAPSSRSTAPMPSWIVCGTYACRGSSKKRIDQASSSRNRPQTPVNRHACKVSGLSDWHLISAAGSTGRCDTIQCLDPATVAPPTLFS